MARRAVCIALIRRAAASVVRDAAVKAVRKVANPMETRKVDTITSTSVSPLRRFFAFSAVVLSVFIIETQRLHTYYAAIIVPDVP